MMSPVSSVLAVWFLEQPLPILAIGAVMMAVAAMAWAHTRQRWAAVSVLGALLLTLGGLALEKFVVTPAEQVADTLDAIARQLERNQPEGLLPFVSASNQELRNEILQRLKMVTVQTVSVKSNLQVTTGRSNPPRTAEARFNAVASLKDRSGYGGDFTVPRFFTVHFVREDDQWRVIRYEMTDPIGGKAKKKFPF